MLRDEKISIMFKYKNLGEINDKLFSVMAYYPVEVGSSLIYSQCNNIIHYHKANPRIIL